MKERLDILLVNRGLFSSREKAKAAIMEGLIYVNGGISDKPGMSISSDSVIEVRGGNCPYVSRGGLKLEKALKSFDLTELSNFVCLDIGASTGGFTDCMLKHGAAKVYAVDVGYGQLAYSLRMDPRVVNIEKCNFRYFDVERIDEKIDFASADVSFISLTMILPIAHKLIKEGGRMVCLVKPQFEAGREQVGKNGIVRDPSVHLKVINKLSDYSVSIGFTPEKLDFSPITGQKGNIEYLLLLNKNSEMEYNEVSWNNTVSQIVSKAHEELGS